MTTILKSLVWLQTESDSTQSSYQYVFKSEHLNSETIKITFKPNPDKIKKVLNIFVLETFKSETNKHLK